MQTIDFRGRIMTEQNTKDLQQSTATEKRDAWVAPEMTVLPVEATATSAVTGNDGNGASSHS
jgi:hypothetical protein